MADAGFQVTETIAITVSQVNRAPVWDDIPQSLNISEDELLAFTVTGSDPDDDDLTITCASDDLPQEVSFTDNGDGTAEFEWRPAFDESGAYTAVFTISDGQFDVSADVIITVGEVNRPPEWDEIPESRAVDEAVEDDVPNDAEHAAPVVEFTLVLVAPQPQFERTGGQTGRTLVLQVEKCTAGKLVAAGLVRVGIKVQFAVI